MTRHAPLFAALAAPFAPAEVKTRPAGRGRQLSYVTSRTVQNRLDEVLGPDGWEFSLAPWGADALVGTLTLTLPDGQQVSKSAVGGRAGMEEGDDDAKSADSDCLKRCAVLWGVGRYLYGDGLPAFVEAALAPPQVEPVPSRNGTQNGHARAVSNPSDFRPGPGGTPRPLAATPRTGRALYAWAKDHQNLGIARWLNGWGQGRGYPGRIVDWTEDEVRAGFEAACSRIAEHNAAKSVSIK